MIFPAKESTHGQKTDFLRALSNELRQEGFCDMEILEFSTSEAFLALFGTPEAVDQALGQGTFQGVKDQTGPMTGWRKLWKNVQAEIRQDAQKAALAAVTIEIERCRQLELKDEEILCHVVGVLHPESLNLRYPTIFGGRGSQERVVKIIVSH